jgi:hypothetical protein
LLPDPASPVLLLHESMTDRPPAEHSRRSNELGALLVRAGAAAVRAHRRAGLRPSVLQRVVWGFLGRALRTTEKSNLGVAIYQTSDFLELRQLTWEKEWYAARLPPPPATVLVGACGSGPEVLYLLGRGYQVVGFDPAGDLLERARARCGGRAKLFHLSYEAMAGAALDGAAEGCAELVAMRFDAALLGLASLNHVLACEDRRRTLRSFVRLCPRGPILASFMMHAPPGGRRAFRVGELAGRWVAQARGLAETHDPGETVVDGLGFIHALLPGEIEAMAEAVDRQLVLEMAPDNGTLATFLPRAGGAP